MQLDIDKLHELSYMAMRPHVKEVMNALVAKLTQEVSDMKMKVQKNKVRPPTWSEIVVGVKNKCIGPEYGVLTSQEYKSDQKTSTMPIQTIINVHTSSNCDMEVKKTTASTRGNMKSLMLCDSNLSIMKSEHKVIILGDSHACSIAPRLKEKLTDKYDVIGFTKPKSSIASIVNTTNQDVDKLSKKDVLIFIGGTNDMDNNN